MAVEVTDKDKVTRLLPEVSEVGTYVRAQVSSERDRATQTEQALSARILEEQEARTQSDVEIRESITKEESRAKGSEEQLAQSITAERTRAEQAESELDSAISIEKSRAQQVESDLQANLTSLSQDLRTEIARASNQEDALQVDIDNERSRAKGAESEIKNSVSAEISRATGVESGLDTRISGIEGKIPNQASASNQLADKDFVNSSINSSAAFYRGSFNTKADLDVWQTANPSVASNNDYAYVQADETHSNEAWRYIFVKEGAEQGQWQAQFRVNEAPLTSEQVAALNSGATKDLIDSIPHKLPINTEQTNFDEVYVKTAQGTQDSLPISKGADDDTIAMRGTGGTLKVGTPLVDKDAVPKDYAEKTFAGLSKQNSFTARNLFYKALEVYTSGGSEACKYDYGKIDYQVLEDGNLVTKTITLPTATGTMALLSDIPTNHVTTDTEQSITAMKTFIGNKLKVQSSSSVYAMYNATQVYLVSGDQTTAYNIDTISRSKGGDSGNTYFYTFPNKSGTFAMLSDIGVDTIYGYLQGTNGISIAKTLAGNKVEVKINNEGFTLGDKNPDSYSNYVNYGNSEIYLAQGGGSGGVKLNRQSVSLIDGSGAQGVFVGNSGISRKVYNSDNQLVTYDFLHENNVKTIGGQSIYGNGDIPVGSSEYANTSEIVDGEITLTNTSTLDDLVTQILAQKTKVTRSFDSTNLKRILGDFFPYDGPPEISYFDHLFKVISEDMIQAYRVYDGYSYAMLTIAKSTQGNSWNIGRWFDPNRANTTSLMDNVITLTSTSSLSDLLAQLSPYETCIVRMNWSDDLARILGTLPNYDAITGADIYVHIKCVFAYTWLVTIQTDLGSVIFEQYISSNGYSGWKVPDNPYPVGSIYQSTSSTSPSSLFGGTWEQIKDVFLLAAGDTYTAGSTGGSADAVVVEHSHDVKIDSYYVGATRCQQGTQDSTVLNPTDGASHLHTVSAGVSGTGKNLPPYLAVYMWRRVA